MSRSGKNPNEQHSKKSLSKDWDEEEIFDMDDDIPAASAPIATIPQVIRQSYSSAAATNPLSFSANLRRSGTIFGTSPLPEIKEDRVLENSDYDSSEEDSVGGERVLYTSRSETPAAPSIARPKKVEEDDLFKDEGSIFFGEDSSLGSDNEEQNPMADYFTEEDEKYAPLKSLQKMGSSPAIEIKFKRPQDPENPYGSFTPFSPWQEKVGKGNGWEEVSKSAPTRGLLKDCVAESSARRYNFSVEQDVKLDDETRSDSSSESSVKHGRSFPIGKSVPVAGDSAIRRTSFPKGEYQVPKREYNLEAKSPTMRANSPLASLGDDESALHALQEQATRKISSCRSQIRPILKQAEIISEESSGRSASSDSESHSGGSTNNRINPSVGSSRKH